MPVEQLFGENGAALYLIASLAIISCTNFSDRERMFLLYLFSFALAVSGMFRIRTCLLLLVCSTFVFLEYLSGDRRKLELVVKLRYKLLDYLYLMFFQYDFPAFGLSMTLLFLSRRLGAHTVLLALSVICLVRAEQWTVSQPFKIKSFTDTARVFDLHPPYAYRHSAAFRRRFELLCAIEDRSYFSRLRSYSCVSAEYLRWRLGGPIFKTYILPVLRRLMLKLRGLLRLLPDLLRLLLRLFRLLLRLLRLLLKPLRLLLRPLRRIPGLLRRLPGLLRRLPSLFRRFPALLRRLPYLFRRFPALLRRLPNLFRRLWALLRPRLSRLLHRLLFWLRLLPEVCARALRRLHSRLPRPRRKPRPRPRTGELRLLLSKLRRLLPRIRLDRTGLHVSGRGYSTPEMQLLRTIGIARGYEQYKLRRKVYEVIYSKIFFSSLKDYHQANSLLELRHYRDYILWIYTRNVLTVINGERCKTFSSAFAGGADVEDWSLEGMFVACLGLSFRPATEETLDMYSDVITAFGLDREKILRIYSRFPRQKLPVLTKPRVRPKKVN